MSTTVADTCFSLYRLSEGARGIIIDGGKPWKHPPVGDAELMHKRLLELKNSAMPLDFFVLIDINC